MHGQEPTIPSGNTDTDSNEETSNTGSDESADNTEQNDSEQTDKKNLNIKFICKVYIWRFKLLKYCYIFYVAVASILAGYYHFILTVDEGEDKRVKMIKRVLVLLILTELSIFIQLQKILN